MNNKLSKQNIVMSMISFTEKHKENKIGISSDPEADQNEADPKHIKYKIFFDMTVFFRNHIRRPPILF